MARSGRRSSTHPSALAVTQHAAAKQTAAPAAGPDAPGEVATLRVQIEALQLSRVQVNDAMHNATQSEPVQEPAGQGQLESVQQARRLGPPWPTDSSIPRRDRRARVWCICTVK